MGAMVEGEPEGEGFGGGGLAEGEGLAEWRFEVEAGGDGREGEGAAVLAELFPCGLPGGVLPAEPGVGRGGQGAGGEAEGIAVGAGVDGDPEFDVGAGGARGEEGFLALVEEGAAFEFEVREVVDGGGLAPTAVLAVSVGPDFFAWEGLGVGDVHEAEAEVMVEGAEGGGAAWLPEQGGHFLVGAVPVEGWARPRVFFEAAVVDEDAVGWVDELGIGGGAEGGDGPGHPGVGVWGRVTERGALDEEGEVFPEAEFDRPFHAGAGFAFADLDEGVLVQQAVAAPDFGEGGRGVGDGEIELDAAGDKAPDGEDADGFDDGVAEQDFLVEAFVAEAIDTSAQFRGDLDAEVVIFEDDHAEGARGGRGIGVPVARVGEEVFAMVEEGERREGEGSVEGEGTGDVAGADHLGGGEGFAAVVDPEAVEAFQVAVQALAEGVPVAVGGGGPGDFGEGGGAGEGEVFDVLWGPHELGPEVTLGAEDVVVVGGVEVGGDGFEGVDGGEGDEAADGFGFGGAAGLGVIEVAVGGWGHDDVMALAGGLETAGDAAPRHDGGAWGEAAFEDFVPSEEASAAGGQVGFDAVVEVGLELGFAVEPFGSEPGLALGAFLPAITGCFVAADVDEGAGEEVHDFG